jgi:chromosome segregation ATPase
MSEFEAATLAQLRQERDQAIAEYAKLLEASAKKINELSNEFAAMRQEITDLREENLALKNDINVLWRRNFAMGSIKGQEFFAKLPTKIDFFFRNKQRTHESSTKLRSILETRRQPRPHRRHRGSHQAKNKKFIPRPRRPLQQTLPRDSKRAAWVPYLGRGLRRFSPGL